jgi:hypothetical protein
MNFTFGDTGLGYREIVSFNANHAERWTSE